MRAGVGCGKEKKREAAERANQVDREYKYIVVSITIN